MVADSISILVVDDRESVSKTMSHILSRLGHSVITANSGSEAVEIAKEHPNIDLVFMDIKMPEMGGVEALKQIKPVLPKAVVVMMTGYSVENLIQDAFEEGANDIIHKPIDFAEVLRRITEVTGSRQERLVLVVDDDRSFTDTFSKVLEKKGLTVLKAETGEQAIQILKEKECDIVFLDMKLPKMSGFETFLTIKQDNSSMVVVIITGFPQEMSNQIDRALAHSAYAYFGKPLDLERVLATVREVISGGNAQ